MSKENDLFTVGYSPWRYPANWTRNIRHFFRTFKLMYERIRKGYCEWDLWDFDHYLETVLINGLKEFCVETQGYPGNNEFPTFESWENYIKEIITLLEHSQEDDENGYYVNEYLEEFEKLPWDLFNNKLPEYTPEEKEIRNKFFEREKEIAALRNEDRDKALQMLTHIWGHLWW